MISTRISLTSLIRNRHSCSTLFSGIIVNQQLKQMMSGSSSSVPVSVTSRRNEYLEMPINQKRVLYKCGNNFVTLDNIKTWHIESEYASKHQTTEPSVPSPEFKPNKSLNEKVSIFVGDITSLEINAIVNAANTGLRGGGGVDGAIHSAAGRDLLQSECQTLGGCETGSAKITGGYKLPAKYIIHTVGPVGEKPGLLESCYRSSLDVLVQNNLRSVAFPCVSTGIYGYPNESAAHVALSTTRRWLESEDNSSKVDRIIFCLFLPVDISLYQKLIQVYFPPDLKST